MGVLAGLSDAGVHVAGADLLIGTSSGATVAAQVADGASPADLFAGIVAEVHPTATATGTTPAARAMRATAEIIAAATDPADMRRRMGAAALEAEAASDGSRSARWRATVAARLPGPHWPRQPVWIVAVDARSGEPVVFDRSSGVDLVDAVAASTSNGVAYAIGRDRYVDGAYRRSGENADLAAGCARVVVLSPLSGGSRCPSEWGMDLATQAEELRAGGTDVVTVVPDSSSEHLFGSRAMDLSLRPVAARAGYARGRSAAGRLAGSWA
ncbi:patatin-like phospholipase family protein [Blastococcus sp. TF02-8]|nr:patatin-like phospholipase family protein [Blastococcus sp. TF02-8]